MAVPDDESCSSTQQPRSNTKGAYYLAKSVLKGSVVLQVVHGHLRSPSSQDIVFGKETSIELVIVGEDGVVQSVCEQTVFGIIKDLAILRWNEKFRAPDPQTVGKDLLVVLSDSGKLSFISYCNEMHRFFAVSHIQLSSPGNSWNQLGRMLAVDANGCFGAVSAYEDQLALFSVSISAGSNIVDKEIIYPSKNEGEAGIARGVQRTNIHGTIWSMCFISKSVIQLSNDGNNPILAVVLHRKGSVLNELLLLGWDTNEHTVHVLSQFTEPGPLALNIVEVPNGSGLALLFRIGDILLMDLSNPHSPRCVYRTSLSFLSSIVEEQNSVEQSSKALDVDDEGSFKFLAARALLQLRDSRMEISRGDDPMSIDSEVGKTNTRYVCAWSWESGNTSASRMIFSVDTGELFAMEISTDPDGVQVNLSDCLYRGLPCKTLLWINRGFIAAVVEMGDGAVLQFENGSLLYRSPIQNIAPILDVSVVDYYDEKQDQMFACCGMAPEGSLRIIRKGISVEKLLRTSPIYQGVTGAWTMKMKVVDSYHSFLVLSFVEETRVLSVGLSFNDVTDAVGFKTDACTLACGLVGDGLLVQIHTNAVRLCLPTTAAHPEGIPLSAPICTSWFPDNVSISLGAVGQNVIIVATSSPCFLFILGARSLSSYHYELYEMQHVRLQNEISCISVPHRNSMFKSSTSFINVFGDKPEPSLPAGVNIDNTFVIGTHKPSVEVLSFSPEKGLRHLSSGSISLTNTLGSTITGCIPQDVRLVLVDRLYVLSGLRNGMLLRFEWPATSMCFSSKMSTSRSPFSSSCFTNLNVSLRKSQDSNSLGKQYRTAEMSGEVEGYFPVHLQIIAIRRIGITPVFLVPLTDSLDADIIALSDRPWLLQAARHSLSYTSISFQPATHVTPVCSVDCPSGILFVAESSLHLVEMVPSKRLNVQRFHLGGTPRKILYHNDSRLLLVMRTDLDSDLCSSDICCVDPLSGSLLSTYKLEPGEIGRSMQLVKVGSEQVLVVGTSQSPGRIIMPSGEAESSSKGRLLVLSLEHMQHSDSNSLIFCSKQGSSSHTSPFREIVGYATEQLSSSSLCSTPDDTSCDETEAWQFRLTYQVTLPGVVLAVCAFLDRYFLASAGNTLNVYGFLNENPQRVRRLTLCRTRFTITCLTTLYTRIAVGDCRDGILFYSYQEDVRKLEQLYCDPVQRLVADCTLMDMDTAIVSDRRGTITVLSRTTDLEENASPECNLTLSCSYYMGETIMSIRKGSFSLKLPLDDVPKVCDNADTCFDSAQHSIVASTLLGSVMIFVPISREEHQLLEAVQARLLAHPLTEPILKNDHNEFRGRGSPDGVPRILDGDMLAQFLELTSLQQEAILEFSLGMSERESSSSRSVLDATISVNQVVRLLERVHYALN